MHRFFLGPEAIRGERVLFPAETARQIREVLRLRPGEKVLVLDGEGREYRVELLQVGREEGEGKVLKRATAEGEPMLRLNLYQALLKGEKFEFVLQKGTELGVASFIPLVSRRCIVADVTPSKRERWQRIIREAAEQSGRGRLPSLAPPQPLPSALEAAQGFSLIPWEGEKSLGLKQALEGRKEGPINLFIGPEGGFEEAEVEMAQSKGVVPVSLGPRILRAETAGLVAASAIFFALGELGG